MSLDIGPLFEMGAQLAAEAIESSGTTVDVTRNPGGTSRATVNRTTLEVTDSTPPATLHKDLPAIVVAQQSSAQQPIGPNQDAQKDAYTVILLPEVTDLRKGDVVTVKTSLDPRLPGRDLKVGRIADGTAGAVRVLYCEAP